MILPQSKPQYSILSFSDFQKYKEKLSDDICSQLDEIFKDCSQRDQDFNPLLSEIVQLRQKLQSQQFRLSIVGEFSRGKSTLINALVGEQIQPVRAIACSGAITVLKHGSKKRIVCHYKNGQKKEVSFEEYLSLATLSKEAARKHRSDELARSQIEEIIFEHPNLEFCQNGVEIVDSPGLNEHPERATITQKLLKNTDAVIFLTFASALLSETERELIDELKEQLSGGSKQEPARNLFIVVNKMDDLDSDEDRQDVKDSVEEFAYGEYPVLAGQNRIHFISAKAALEAKCNNNRNDYIDSFEEFTKSLEYFLINERGNTELNYSFVKLGEIIQNGWFFLDEYEVKLNQNTKNTETKQQALIEQIGELSGQSVRLEILIKRWIKELEIPLRKQLKSSWNKWIRLSLFDDLKEKSKKWESDGDVVWKQEEVVEDYTDKFKDDLINAIIEWGQQNKNSIDFNIKSLDDRILNELKSLGSSKLSSVNLEKVFLQQLPYEFKFKVDKKAGYGDFLPWIGTLFFVGLLFGSDDSIRNQIREEVIKKGLEQFYKIQSTIFQKLYETVTITFETRIERVKEIMTQVMNGVQADLDNQDKEYKKILRFCEAEKAWIYQKRQELEQVQNNIDVIIQNKKTIEHEH
ncbi:MAG: dynamin family protein [Coleofasciculus sp. G3-WIS-01]|uniref:dynamin family protein n=1 Tax=Coleofasciculus sp. G3-WIS-01 TaxID=3069528 RepID=UPI003301C885